MRDMLFDISEFEKWKPKKKQFRQRFYPLKKWEEWDSDENLIEAASSLGFICVFKKRRTKGNLYYTTAYKASIELHFKELGWNTYTSRRVLFIRSKNNG